MRDTTLLQGDANAVAADTKRFFSKTRLERAATRDERSRVSREVHDGVLQVLTGISLQLAVLARLIESNPKAALTLASELDKLVTAEQCALRAWLGQGTDESRISMASPSDLTAALASLCQRAEPQWGLHVELIHGPQRAVPRLVADHVYRLIQEAIANVGKHARAAHVRVRLSASGDTMRVMVTDDGVGFPFHGEYDLERLQKGTMGPRSIVQRVASLNGALILTSTSSGSTLEITLPLSSAHPDRGFASA